MHQRSELSYGYSPDIYHGRGGPSGHYPRRDYGDDAGNYYPERHPAREGSYEYGAGGEYGEGPYSFNEPELPEPGTREFRVPRASRRDPSDLQGLGVTRNVEEPYRGRGLERAWGPGRGEPRPSGFPSGGGAYEHVESFTWDAGPHAGRGPKGYRRSDERITEEICERLTDHGGVDASEIEVVVENGEVILKGIVESRRAKRLAEAVADTVRGVEDIHNRLRLAKHRERESTEAEAPH